MLVRPPSGNRLQWRVAGISSRSSSFCFMINDLAAALTSTAKSADDIKVGGKALTAADWENIQKRLRQDSMTAVINKMTKWYLILESVQSSMLALRTGVTNAL